MICNRPGLIAVLYYGSRVYAKYGSDAGGSGTEGPDEEADGERAPLLGGVS